MQVMVLISKTNGNEQRPTLLVLRDHPGAAIPRHLQPVEWTYFATVAVDDALLGAPPEAVVADIERQGYALVSPTH
jgi:hypothetical protein